VPNKLLPVSFTGTLAKQEAQLSLSHCAAAAHYTGG